MVIAMATMAVGRGGSGSTRAVIDGQGSGGVDGRSPVSAAK